MSAPRGRRPCTTESCAPGLTVFCPWDTKSTVRETARFSSVPLLTIHLAPLLSPRPCLPLIIDSSVYDVLPYAIAKLQIAGYRLVTVAECLGEEPYQYRRAPAKRNVGYTIQYHKKRGSDDAAGLVEVLNLVSNLSRFPYLCRYARLSASCSNSHHL